MLCLASVSGRPQSHEIHFQSIGGKTPASIPRRSQAPACLPMSTPHHPLQHVSLLEAWSPRTPGRKLATEITGRAFSISRYHDLLVQQVREESSSRPLFGDRAWLFLVVGLVLCYKRRNVGHLRTSNIRQRLVWWSGLIDFDLLANGYRIVEVLSHQFLRLPAADVVVVQIFVILK